MTALVIRAETSQLPLPDNSVDLIITSPPYYSLRAYTDNGQRYSGQLGAEATPAEYIDALIDCTVEWVRVLKPSGSLFVNLGDKYARTGGVDRKKRGHPYGDPGGRAALRPSQRCPDGVPPKSLLMLPERYRIGAVDRLGLTARAVIVWSKPNGLPESVRDRVRRSHEDWVHLTQGPRYYSAVDEIRESLDAASDAGGLGRLPSSVWSIATEPLYVPSDLGVRHFSAFPTAWPVRLITGWSARGICIECGEGRKPLVERPGLLGGGEGVFRLRQSQPDQLAGYVCACTPYTDDVRPRGSSGINYARSIANGRYPSAGQNWGGRQNLAARPRTGPQRVYHLCDWQPAPTKPAVVLDPLGGTGTTALSASILGRIGITVDRSGDYCRLARWRTTDPTVRAKLIKKVTAGRKPP